MDTEPIQTPQQTPYWITMTYASEIFEISITKLSNMAKEGRIKSRENPRDRRMRMVDMRELQRIFTPLNNEGWQ